MKEKQKKILKWSSIVVASIIIIIAITILTFVVVMYNKVYEEIEYVERSGEYSMPECPESDIVPMEGSYVEDDESYTDIFDDVSGDDNISTGNTSGSNTNNGNNGSTGTLKETPIYIVEPIDENIINVLLIGRDVTEASGSHGRSDSMMILSYNKETGEVSINSLLRDSLVPIEGYGWNRLNATFSWGGAGLTINTINEVYGLDIQHYISIDYSGFTNLIDQVGGVTVSITQKEAEYMNDRYDFGLSEGEATFNGKYALVFAQIRKGLGDDWGRTERQRRIIVSVMNKVLAMDKVSDTINLIYDNLDYVKTNLSSGTIISLTYDFFDKNNSNINTDVIPAKDTWYYATYKGMSIIKLDFDKNKAILRERIYGE